MSNQESVIEVKNLTKEFVLPHKKHNSLKQVFINLGRRGGVDRRKVLNNISFDIKKGDFLGIVGRNGSGKSTLLKILAGVYTPTNGHVWIKGSLTPFIELGVGFNMELSGRDNVFLNGALLGFTHKQMELMYSDIVNFAELHDFMDQKLKNYSSGMQVRLAFSIAIRAQSDILLIDEVLAVGDAAFQQKCFNYFEDLKSSDKTVVFVTHDMTSVRRFCNKAIYIKDGLKTHEGSPGSIADMYAEENINNAQTNNNKLVFQSGHYAMSTELRQSKGEYILDINYKSKGTDNMYASISIIRDGYSVAGITSENSLNLKGVGKLIYRLDTKNLNSGAYVIQAGLFKRENRELLAISKKIHPFVVRGGDMSREGALRLADAWEFNDPKK